MATFHVHRACLTTDIGQIRELFTLEQFFSSPEANLACLCESAYIYIFILFLYIHKYCTTYKFSQMFLVYPLQTQTNQL